MSGVHRVGELWLVPNFFSPKNRWTAELPVVEELMLPGCSSSQEPGVM